MGPIAIIDMRASLRGLDITELEALIAFYGIPINYIMVRDIDSIIVFATRNAENSKYKQEDTSHINKAHFK
jgi:hypothetical protein